MSRPIRKIVLGFDFSAHARAALAAAQKIASRWGSELHVVTAATGAVEDNVVEVVAASAAPKLRGEFLGRLEAYVRDQVEEVLGGAVRVTYHIGMGPAAHSLLATVAERHADLLVVGAVGNREPAPRSHVGADVERLLRASQAPVLVVCQGVEFPPRRALCAVDFSPASAEALGVAANLTRLGEGNLEVLHVVLPVSVSDLERYFPAWPADLSEAHHDEARRKMSAFLGWVDTNGVPAHTEITEAAPHQAILARTLEGGFDLLAFGAMGRGERTAQHIGQNAERLLRAAPCNLLAVQPPAEALELPPWEPVEPVPFP